MRKNLSSKFTSVLFITAIAVLVFCIGILFRPLGELDAIAANPPNPPTTHVQNDMGLLDISTPTQNESNTDETTPYRNVLPLTQKVNGIEVTARNFQRNGMEVVVDLCYPIPDEADWLLADVRLQYGQVSISDYYLELIEIKEMLSPGEPGYRCDALSFEVPSKADLSKLTLVVESFSAYPREGRECEAYLNKLADKITDRGIKVKCEYEDWGPDLLIIDKPESMSQEKAEELISLVDFFITRGPWIFDFSIGD